MSRPCAPRSWPTSRTAKARASASSAARPMTARAGPSPSSAYPALAKRRAQAARPRRGRRAAHVRTVEAIPSAPSEGAPRQGASGRRIRTRGRPGAGQGGPMPREAKAARGSAASTVLQRSGTATVEMACRERTIPGIRRANASLTGLKAGRGPRRAKADPCDPMTRAGRASVASTVPKQSATVIVENGRHRHGARAIRRANASLIRLRAKRVPLLARADRRDRTTRAVARAQTSNQDRRVQERVTEIGSRALAAARAAKADRRAVAPHHQGGALARQARLRLRVAGGSRPPPRKR